MTSVSPRVRWNEVVAVLGGSFDPPHRGHREAAAGLFQNPGVREVWVIPSATPPDKPARISAVDRLRLAELAFLGPDPEAPLPGPVRVDPRELLRAQRTQLPSYSFDTLSEIRREVPALAMVIGADRLSTLSHWHRFGELLELCHWIVLERRPEGNLAARQTLRDWEASGLARAEVQGPDSDSRWILRGGKTQLALVQTPARAVSSTQIREAIARTGQPPEGSLSPEVSDQLKREQLYGTKRQ